MRLLSSLTNRIFLASSLLAVLSISVAVYVVNAAVTTQAEAELARGLEEAGLLVEQFRAMLFENFTRQARLIADLPKFKAAVALDDPPTLQPLAEEYRAQIDCDVLVVTNRAGTLLARAGDAGVRLDGDATAASIRGALSRTETTAFWPSGDGVLQAVSVPVSIGLDQPELLGTLSVGFRLDRRLAERFKALTDSEIAFAAGGLVQAATLPPDFHEALGRIPGGGVARLALGDDEYVAVVRPLGSQVASGASPGAGAAPAAIILRSRTERLRFLRPLHTALAATALFAVFAAVLVSYGIARTVTRPLGAVTAAMKEMASTGDLGRLGEPPRVGPWDDEDARLLARTFGVMTESIARFQREAAQRERLSALGRLSTVVAHEIRNPLMIIKAALRTLRQPDADPRRAQAALQDIDEETARLNRIVSEVLDFARPIRFELAPADLNALCHDAVHATVSRNDAAGIHLSLDPRLPRAVTDAERLRLALVNILTNARHAIDERETPGPKDRPVIELSTHAVDDSRVAIVIRDRGMGIPAEVLPRIFEPYFTTKRTGSGLGLAIARNIIEGLGGSIVAANLPEGAEIRVELPLRGPSGPAKARPVSA